MRTLVHLLEPHRAGVLTLCAGLAGFFVQGTASAQSSSAEFRSSYEREWSSVMRRIESLAEAVPEDAYSWRPNAEVRSMSEVLMHISHGLFQASDALGSDRPNDLPRNLETIVEKRRVQAMLQRARLHFEAAADDQYEDLNRGTRPVPHSRGRVRLRHSTERPAPCPGPCQRASRPVGRLRTDERNRPTLEPLSWSG